MTKKLFILCMAVVWATTMMAQKIAVVSPSGETTLFKTLTEAADSAETGSVIYLPGGSFSVSNYFVIHKKLTIIGIGHKARNDNPDCRTIISGTIYFGGESDGSALMGCYVTGQVYVGQNGTGSDICVNDVMIKYNNIAYIHVTNSRSGVVINQNIARIVIAGNLTVSKASGVCVTNNIVKGVNNFSNSFISNNLIFGVSHNSSGYPGVDDCSDCSITDNIIFLGIGSVPGCFISGNLMIEDYDDNINLGEVDWNDVFVKYDSSNPWNSDFHLKGEYKQYENQVGIYAGTGFNDKQLAPVPYIVAKHVDDQTDAQGKLNIRVRVSAGDSE